MWDMHKDQSESISISKGPPKINAALFSSSSTLLSLAFMLELASSLVTSRR